MSFLSLLLISFGVFIILRDKYLADKIGSTVKQMPDTIQENLDKSVFTERYPYATLENTWIAYKENDIQNDGRTVDKSANLLTTSEGQSYSLLRAVWVDDKATFDEVLTWTKNNLQKRPNDNLLSWKWGQRSDGSWGVLEEDGGLNTASDADLDIALALILASERWNDDYYMSEARKILTDVWMVEVIEIQGRPYLTAGNWAKLEENPAINPSYFNLAGYPLFAGVDPVHDWMALKDTSYEILNSSTDMLPPDWIRINRNTGELIPDAEVNGNSEKFSDDAVRIPWRVGLDWEWHKDPRAEQYMKKLDAINELWSQHRAIFREYKTDGTPLSNNETLSTYGAVLPYFVVRNPQAASEIFRNKLAKNYNVDQLDFSGDANYYSKNWAWFGMAFYQDFLKNYYEEDTN